MSNVNNFSQLLSENKIGQAIDFCEKMIEKHPEFSFYHFWLSKLTNENKTGVETKSYKLKSTINKLVIEDVKDKINSDFSKYSYNISEGKSVDISEKSLLTEKNSLVKSFPFSGEIYLPTSKINLPEQVVGLRKVADLVSEENKKTSKHRFEALKETIKSTGKKRVFILGNGPSLKQTDLELLKNEITIGFNGIFLHDTFTPTIHVVEDHLVAEDRVNEIVNYQCPVKVFPSYLGYCLPVQDNTIFLNHLSRKSFPVDTDFSDDVGDISYTGGTVTYTGLQIAVSLGFEEIYLIGVDASYKVENVERSTDYGTGVLESKSDDINHFDSRYFGKGYRWHDPNVHTMLQAYRKVRNYAKINNVKVMNATIGGELDVFPRVNYNDLFDFDKVYPKTAIIDFTHIDWLCATGIVKKNMFDGWANHSLLHVHGQHPDFISSYQKVKNDCYAAGADKNGIWATLRTLMEYNPDILYFRPTHDRPALSIMQLIMPIVLNKPFVVHYMDDWLAKIEMLNGKAFADIYYQAMKLMFTKANKVLTISQKMADYLAQAFNIEKSRLQVVHNYIQPQGALALPKANDCKVVRYFGGMEPDMSLASIKSIAEAVDTLHSSGSPIRFEIYTGQNYIDRFSQEFEAFSHTTLSKQHDNYQVYLALLESSDLNVLCYNFDKKSEVYLKYSMANKLPETIGANVPFLAIGSAEIGTITYLLEEAYPFVIDKQNQQEVNRTIKHILFDKDSASDEYFDALTRLKEEFSAARNQHGFQNMLRTESSSPLATFDKQDLELITSLTTQLIVSLGERAKKYASLKIMPVLLNLSIVDRQTLVNLMESHGVSWQFKQKQKAIETIVRKKAHSSNDVVDMLAFLITSLEHERFREINMKIKQILGMNE